MKISQQKTAFPFFLLFLTVFFVFHGYTQNPESVTAADFYSLTGEYLLATGIVFLLGLLLFRRWQKAALFAFCLLFLNFFFGPIHDSLKKITEDFFLAKYSVLLPLLLCLIVVLFVFLKHSKKDFRRFFIYLNLIFLLLILIDLPAAFQPKKSRHAQASYPACDSCEKPDVYLIIADEYADSVSLAQTMQFDNGVFLAALRSRGFHVLEETRSNYNFTPFSMASLFRMDYLPGIVGSNSNKDDREFCAGVINQNPVLDFFVQNGYAVENCSIFNVNNQPSSVQQKYLLLGKDLIASQTLLDRIRKDLGYHLATTLKLKSEIERYTYYTKHCNEKVIGLLRQEMAKQSSKPRFIYTHLLMPHYPYYFDADGNERPFSFFAPGYEFNEKAYTEYLQYGNRIFLGLIDEILAKSRRPPVILFMGDHGFREYAVPVDTMYHYRNMNALYLPNKNYQPFYKGISSVNHFRALLNAAFGQRLPMLKDSTVLIRD